MKKDRYDYVEDIFNNYVFQVRTTHLKTIEIKMVDMESNEGERSALVNEQMIQGVQLDPSGGMFVDDVNEDHDALLESVMRGDPHKLALSEFDDLSIDLEAPYRLTVNGIVELFNMERSVTLVNPRDCFDIYNLLNGYIESLEKDSFMSMNSVDIPQEDLEKMTALRDSLLPLIYIYENEDDSKKELDPFLAYFADTGYKPPVKINTDGSATVNAAKPDRESEKGFSTLPPELQGY